MKKIKLFPKIFLFTFAMMLLISFIAHLLIFLIAPAQNVLVTNILVTNAGASTLSEVDMPRLITQTMLKTFPISILCCAAISALFSYFFSRGITTPILSLSKSANQMLKLEPDAKAIVMCTMPVPPTRTALGQPAQCTRSSITVWRPLSSLRYNSKSIWLFHTRK